MGESDKLFAPGTLTFANGETLKGLTYRGWFLGRFVSEDEAVGAPRGSVIAIMDGEHVLVQRPTSEMAQQTDQFLGAGVSGLPPQDALPSAEEIAAQVEELGDDQWVRPSGSFVKLYDPTGKSIMEEAPIARLLFLQTLPKLDHKGFLRIASLSLLAKNENIPEAEIARAYQELTAPDPVSGYQPFQGRRWVPVRGGIIVPSARKPQSTGRRSRSKRPSGKLWSGPNGRARGK
jgi:hypothetical protein